MLELKKHLLIRVQQSLGIEHDPNSNSPGETIFFHGDRMYSHKIIRLNYTTYDVRRAQDVVNPGTPNCNIMLLASSGANQCASQGPTTTGHRFLYARVLGIYHTNIIYTGPGMRGYTPKRMDFLWVRWYDHQEGRDPARLDQLSFPPVAYPGALSFIDPADVLRSCHIIPRFSKGKRHTSGTGFSRLARDGDDWVAYNVDR